LLGQVLVGDGRDRLINAEKAKFDELHRVLMLDDGKTDITQAIRQIRNVTEEDSECEIKTKPTDFSPDLSSREKLT
jgi:hypothetical protein